MKKIFSNKWFWITIAALLSLIIILHLQTYKCSPRMCEVCPPHLAASNDCPPCPPICESYVTRTADELGKFFHRLFTSNSNTGGVREIPLEE